jgi:hypothetical protein
MKLPFGMSLRDIIQDMIAAGAVGVVVWLAGYTPEGAVRVGY